MAANQYELKEHFSASVGEHGPNAGINDLATLDKEVKEGFTVNDQRDMQRMGKRQEFRRNFAFLTTVGFTCCVMGTWEILMTSNTQALLAGGSAGLFWSLVWAYTGQTFIVLSLSELASMAPTAGGQYHWVSEFAPEKYQKILSYLSGWLSTISWQSIVALNCWLVGVIVQSLIVINDEETYVPTRWQATLLIFASVLFVGGFNVFGAKHLPLAEGIFVSGHFGAFFPIMITILVLAPKRPAREVFLEFSDNGSGWPNLAWSTLVGQVSAMFCVLGMTMFHGLHGSLVDERGLTSAGSDSVAHMAEEVKDAGVIVPKAMIWSFILNIPFTFVSFGHFSSAEKTLSNAAEKSNMVQGMVVSYLFCMPSVADAVEDPTGFPFIYVFRQATGSAGGTTGLTIVILFLITMITISAFASTSRQTFAFARDRGLPFSSWLGQVHVKWRVPVNSVIFTIIFTMVVSLINIGSTVAFNALLSLSTVALMATYVISIGCVILRRFNPTSPLPPSRWSLGRAGLPINIIALTYAVWAFFWSFWPNSHNIVADNFNYASVLFVGLMGLSTILYFVHARKVYDGPVATVEGRGKNA